MRSIALRPGAWAQVRRAAGGWAVGWWRVVHLGAVLLVLACTPSSYRTAGHDASARFMIARFIYLGTMPALGWFTVLSSLISLIVIRIVLVTAFSYGLTQYALGMVVRVLVLELIPLTAALFAALRCSIPYANEITALRKNDVHVHMSTERLDALRGEVLPRVTASVFCALMLAAVSCVLTLLLAYFSVYGATLSGFDAYTHTVGQIFSPSVALIFALKIVLFGMTVALLPIVSALTAAPQRSGMSIELQGLVRMSLVLLAIEAVSLVGNYY